MSNSEQSARNGVPEPVARNIAAIQQWKVQRKARRSTSDRLADAVSGFAGSMPFVYTHLIVFGFWIIANLGFVPGVPAWDPTLVVLAMIASVEAIFLSAFVLINQNHMALEADERAELDLQVSLLNERETTRLVAMTKAIAEHLGVNAALHPDLGDLQQETDPHAILEAVDEERLGHADDQEGDTP